MIAVDTSALVCIVMKEGEAELFSSIIARGGAKIGAPTIAEARIVIESKAGQTGLDLLHEILERPTISIEPFDHRHAAAAHRAHRRYGKGRGHPAKLNICDRFSYAIASCDDLPLLLKGDDFIHTDIRPACLP